MHRMRHFVMLTGLALAVWAATGGRASAGLIEPNPVQTYPDLFSGNINGKVTYKYDAARQQGVFTAVNLPTYIATGLDNNVEEIAVTPMSDGVRRQEISVALDQNGQIVPDSANSFKLFGSVILPVPTIDQATGLEATKDMTISGLLLEGTPTAFGGVAVPGSGLSTFDMKMQITGGELADYFGKEAYIEITPKIGSTFDGSYTKDFEGFKVTSNTRGTFITPPPLPVPEPATYVLILVGGAGVIYRHRRRLRG